MNLKIRQYLSANTLLPVAKVFARSVDITYSGFGSKQWLLSFEINPDLKSSAQIFANG